MNDRLPFCEECGCVGAGFSGLKPDDAGTVRWTLYKCGHMKTEIVIEPVAAAMPVAARRVP